MHRRLIKFFIFAALLLVVGMGASECDDTNVDDKQRESSVKARAQTFAKAEAKIPLPTTSNFPLRQTLVEMTKREDLANHPWYIYVLGDAGNQIGYYVGKTAPVNACNFLSSTQKVKEDYDGGNLILQAPSIDGIYYGNAQCNVWVFLDYASGALIKIGDVKFFTSDKPLNVNSEAIKVGRSTTG